MFIKICGITSDADARMVAAAGANAIGINFYPQSPRAVGIAAAREVIAALPVYVDAVGVFVNTDAAEMRATAQQFGLRTLQVHGNATPELVAVLSEFAVVPAFPLAVDASAQSVIDFIAACERLGRLPSAILIDASVPGKFGGTGQTAPWALAKSLVARCRVPVILAGGLTSRNVAEAIRTIRPWGVDVASGVEVAAGRKEAFKVKSFVEAVRSVGR